MRSQWEPHYWYTLFRIWHYWFGTPLTQLRRGRQNWNRQLIQRLKQLSSGLTRTTVADSVTFQLPPTHCDMKDAYIKTVSKASLSGAQPWKSWFKWKPLLLLTILRCCAVYLCCLALQKLEISTGLRGTLGQKRHNMHFSLFLSLKIESFPNSLSHK